VSAVGDETGGGNRRFVGWVLAIAAGGLAIRVVYILAFRRQQLPLPFYDALVFHLGGNDLAQGHGFVDAFTRAPAAAHPPLYLMWLAIASYLSPGHAATPTTHMLWSSLLGVGTIVLCGLTGREIAGRRVGLIAAGFAALYPNLWINDGLLMSEPMAMLCVAGVLYTTYRFVHRPSLWRAAWIGLLCGLATLSRSELVLTIPLVLAVVVLTTSSASWKSRFQWVVVAGIVSVLVFTPWVAYNLSRFDKPVYLSSQLGGTVVTANCPSTYYGSDIGFKDYACQAVARNQAKRTVPHWNRLGPADQDAELGKIGNRYIRDHLSRLPVVVLARWGRILGVYRPLQEVNAEHRDFALERWAGILLTASFWVAAALSIVGIVGVRRRRERVWPLLAFPVIVLVSVALTFGQTRYRAPAEVSLVLLAAVGIDVLIRWYRREPATDAAPDQAIAAPTDPALVS
jgi:4-amino-4-deoxy-L-arabinose transferase-like glycosyltransferase